MNGVLPPSTDVHTGAADIADEQPETEKRYSIKGLLSEAGLD